MRGSGPGTSPRGASTPIVDPPIPPDGSCAQCGKPRRPERSARYAKDAALRDPFCSTNCARTWHGTQLVMSPATARDYCAQCGGPIGEYTDGCRTCDGRLKKRETRAAA